MVFPGTARQLLGFAWIIFCAYWFIAAFFVSRAVKRQSILGRAGSIALGAIPYFFLFRNESHHGWLARRFVPDQAWVVITGIALTYAGIAVAIWARVALGRNWSGTVTIKQDHQLIRTGPYSVVRHPIYSGLLLALLGTALAVGETRGLVALAGAFLMGIFKARTEERFMIEQFGSQYEDYRKRTKALVPFIL